MDLLSSIIDFTQKVSRLRYDSNSDISYLILLDTFHSKHNIATKDTQQTLTLSTLTIYLYSSSYRYLATLLSQFLNSINKTQYYSTSNLLNYYTLYKTKSIFKISSNKDLIYYQNTSNNFDSNSNISIQSILIFNISILSTLYTSIPSTNTNTIYNK